MLSAINALLVKRKIQPLAHKALQRFCVLESGLSLSASAPRIVNSILDVTWIGKINQSDGAVCWAHVA